MSQGSLGRAWRIFSVFCRYRLDLIARAMASSQPELLRLFWLNPLQLKGKPRQPDPVRLRLAIEALGPVFIKFGQILSTRRDLLPPDYAVELAKLQDQVPPFSTDAARAVVEKELGAPIRELFARFEAAPLAAASVAQVYGAQLLSGEQVVVKVLRPDIEQVIREDLILLADIASTMERWFIDAQRLHLTEVVADFEQTLLAELDLRAEAQNAQRLRLNFADSDTLYVPRVYATLVTRNVMVSERIYGLPISAVDKLRAANTDMRVLAERGVQTFFTQVFEHNFFHADMHPGNVYVDITEPANPKYIALDCAIMGQLTARDQEYLARNLLAFFYQDYAEVARLHLDSGWIPADTDAGEFEAVIQEVCEPIFNKPIAEISFGLFLISLFQTARRFNMEAQPQLVLLQKTLLNIEGLGRELYPELDLWATAKPYMERWMAQRVGPEAVAREVAERLPELPRLLPRLPGLIADAEQNLFNIRLQLKRTELLQAGLSKRLERTERRLRSARIAGLALILAILVSALSGFGNDGASSVPLIAGSAALGVAGLLLLRR